VWDEFAGYFITMIAAPAGWQWIVIGFVLFRFFDILKPWPISLADKKLKGGFGIMFDDILAGLAALACMQILAHYAPVIGI
jgi:phosphatidylglycerophosphatase A